MEKRRVLRILDRKTATESAKVTCSGKLLQTRAATTEKAWSPTVYRQSNAADDQ